VGTSRAIYLFCQRHRSLKRILAHFPGIAEDKIVPFLRMMVDKRLMFEENGKYLSLAIPVRPASRRPHTTRLTGSNVQGQEKDVGRSSFNMNL
jgi:hypothetical protein